MIEIDVDDDKVDLKGVFESSLAKVLRTQYGPR